MNQVKLTKADVGKYGTFHGFDGKLYRGYVSGQRGRGWFAINYYVPVDFRMEEICTDLSRAEALAMSRSAMARARVE